MKVYGSLSELLSVIFKKDNQAITFRPNASTTFTAARDLQTPPRNGDEVLVGELATQTLSNKTLTSPVINSPTGLVKADVGLSNVDNTSDATKNAAVATLTNKTLTSPVINSPTGLVKADVGLSNVDNTSDATKNAAAVTLSNKTLTFLRTATESGTVSSNTITLTSGLFRITGGDTTLTTVSGVSDGQAVVIFNNSGVDITVTNAGNIQTGTGVDFTLKNGAATTLSYSSSATKWLLSGGAGGGGLATSVRTTTFTAAAGNHYLCSTSGGAYTATLPAGSAGAVIRFSDEARTWASSNLTIAPATGQFIGTLAVNETLVCDLTGAFVQLMWDGTNWVIDTNGYAASITSGSLGSAFDIGAKNYIGNANNATNWVASGGGITVATEATISNLAANATQTSGIRVTRVSGTTIFARYRFTLDIADYSKKFSISFDQKFAGAAGDYTLAVFSNTLADYTGTSTQLTLQTSSIPALNGSFNTTVDMPSSAAPFIEFRIIAAAGTAPLYLNNVYVGPGIITQGAAISDAVTYVPGVSGFSLTSPAIEYRRVGAKLLITGRFTVTSPAASEMRVNLPPGLTVGSYAGSSITGIVGKFARAISTVSSQKQGVVIAVSGNTYMNFSFDDYTATRNPATPLNADGIFLTGEICYFEGEASIPIAEWAGNGTVNLGAGAQVEYAWNTTTSDADDTTSFGYGPGGVLVPNISGGTNRTKVVSFQYPIQADDLLVLELNIGADTTNVWTDAATYLGNASTSLGVLLYRRVGTTNQVDVVWGFNGHSSTVANAAGTWAARFTNGWRWRVRKAKASSPVGFGKADSLSSGLVNPRRGQTNLTFSANPPGWSLIRAVGIYYQDQDGNHRLKFSVSATITSSTGGTATIIGVTFKNVVSYNQPLNAALASTITWNAYTGVNNGNISLDTASSQTNFKLSGDVELESRPTWA